MTWGTRRDRLVFEAGLALVSIPVYVFLTILHGMKMPTGGVLPGVVVVLWLTIVVGFGSVIAFLVEVAVDHHENHY